MIFEALDYIFGWLKMLLYKLFYLNKLKYRALGKYSKQFQIRIMKKGKLIIGKNAVCRAGTKIRIHGSGVVTIGDDVGFNYYCLVNSHCSITIGDHTIVGQGVKFYDHDHNYDVKGEWKDNGFSMKPITVGKNVWIGSDCIILKGATIGDNCVIAAGSVIRGTIPPDSIVYQRIDEVIKPIEFH